jgi:hypothetical protein
MPLKPARLCPSLKSVASRTGVAVTGTVQADSDIEIRLRLEESLAHGLPLSPSGSLCFHPLLQPEISSKTHALYRYHPLLLPIQLHLYPPSGIKKMLALYPIPLPSS